MKKTYSEMTIAELKAELVKLEQEIEDLEDDKSIMLGQKGQHINATSIIERFNVMFRDTEEKMAEVKKLLEAGNG